MYSYTVGGDETKKVKGIMMEKNKQENGNSLISQLPQTPLLMLIMIKEKLSEMNICLFYLVVI